VVPSLSASSSSMDQDPASSSIETASRRGGSQASIRSGHQGADSSNTICTSTVRPAAAWPRHGPNQRAVRSGSVTLAHTSSAEAR
jgi:hypothetical protein